MFFLVHTLLLLSFFFFKQKTAYEMRISDWSSDVCSADLGGPGGEQVSTIADTRDILLAPVISEKSYGLIEEGTYTFLVHPDSNKTQIKRSAERRVGKECVRTCRYRWSQDH